MWSQSTRRASKLEGVGSDQHLGAKAKISSAVFGTDSVPAICNPIYWEREWREWWEWWEWW